MRERSAIQTVFYLVIKPTNQANWIQAFSQVTILGPVPFNLQKRSQDIFSFIPVLTYWIRPW